jgi:hypothetical protein
MRCPNGIKGISAGSSGVITTGFVTMSTAMRLYVKPATFDTVHWNWLPESDDVKLLRVRELPEVDAGNAGKAVDGVDGVRAGDGPVLDQR